MSSLDVMIMETFCTLNQLNCASGSSTLGHYQNQKKKVGKMKWKVLAYDIFFLFYVELIEDKKSFFEYVLLHSPFLKRDMNIILCTPLP